MLLNFYEIFDLYAKCNTKEERISFLRKNDSKALRDILFYTFNPNITFYRKSFPFGYKPNTESPVGLSYSHLHMESKRFYIFTTTYEIPLPKKDIILLQLLESLEEKEAELVMGIFGKDLRVDHLTRSIVREAFPGLLPNPGK